MKRKNRLTAYIAIILIALLTRASVPADNIKLVNKTDKQAKLILTNANSINNNIIDNRKAHIDSISFVKVNLYDGIKLADPYVIIMLYLYFLLCTPPPYIDKRLSIINSVYFNGSKYKRKADSFLTI